MEINISREKMLEELAKDIVIALRVEIVDADKGLVQILRNNSPCNHNQKL